MRLFLYITAIVTFVSFWVAGFSRDGTNLYVVASAVLFAGSLICWIASIYIWSLSGRRRAASLVTLTALVLFGFICGWLYVLLRGHELTRVASPTHA